MPFEYDQRQRSIASSQATTDQVGARANPLLQMRYDEAALALKPTVAAQKPGFADVAAGHARSIDDKQSEQIKAKGEGDYTGTKSGESGKKKTSCIGYVLDVLAQTFASIGKTADWDRIRKQAYRQSGAGGIKGTELMKVLQSELGWVGVFWAPDTKSGDGENDYSARKAKTKGSYYGIKVDKDKLVTDYSPGGGRKAESEAIRRLRRVKFGVLAAKGGTHMTMILSGHVFEVHWSDTSDSHNLFEDAGDLSNWGWGSGAIVMPPEEAAGWNTPLD